MLHRSDRAMIYVFIAASYFPWLTIQPFPLTGWTAELWWIVWVLASLGILYQQLFHERYKCLETCFYLFMGIVPSIAIISMVSIQNIYNFIDSIFQSIRLCGKLCQSIWKHSNSEGTCDMAYFKTSCLRRDQARKFLYKLNCKFLIFMKFTSLRQLIRSYVFEFNKLNIWPGLNKICPCFIVA